MQAFKNNIGRLRTSMGDKKGNDNQCLYKKWELNLLLLQDVDEQYSIQSNNCMYGRRPVGCDCIRSRLSQAMMTLNQLFIYILAVEIASDIG